jgi:hypothetical protein
MAVLKWRRPNRKGFQIIPRSDENQKETAEEASKK